MLLNAWQRTEQLHFGGIGTKSSAVPADEAGMEPWSHGTYVFGQTCEGEREESLEGSPEQRKAGFTHLRCPGFQLTGERKELCSGQEVLEFWRWCWRATPRGLFSSDSRKRHPVSL